MSKRRRYKTERHLAKVQAKTDKLANDVAEQIIKADPRDIFADRVKATVAPTTLVGKPDIHEAQMHQAYLNSDKVDPWRNSYLMPRPHRFGPGYDDIHTQRATRHDDSVSEMLMRRGLGLKLEEGLTAGQLKNDIKQLLDDRPLIDKLHEATFHPPSGLQWIKDPYMLRNTLRKAHCFTIEAETSELMVDFAMAIAPDLDGARMLAVPPFPTTWFQIDNKARLRRAVQLGGKLTATAASEEVIAKVGWLVTTTGPNDYCMTYVCELEQGMMIPPLSWNWTTAPSGGRAVGPDDEGSKLLNDQLLFGMTETNIEVGDAWLFAAPFQRERRIPSSSVGLWLNRDEMELMVEIAGELRYMFGLLVALGAAQHGAVSSTTPQPVTQGPPVVAKGKTLLPIEHKVLTIKLSKRHTVEKVTTRAITGIKHRWHEVRGHFRTKYNADGTMKWRIPIKPHARGDERLGRVEKTYKIEK